LSGIFPNLTYDVISCDISYNAFSEILTPLCAEGFVFYSEMTTSGTTGTTGTTSTGTTGTTGTTSTGTTGTTGTTSTGTTGTTGTTSTGTTGTTSTEAISSIETTETSLAFTIIPPFNYIFYLIGCLFCHLL